MSQAEYLPSPYRGDRARWKRYSSDSILAIVGALLVTGTLFVFHLYPRIPNISVAYLFQVPALASTWGLFSAALASVATLVSFYFFLVPPLYSFTIGKVV